MSGGLLAEAVRAQARASAPDASVWVTASAGTGKTKVLTDRVLALMLTGTHPGRLLCLTFTKAAAAEMANRLAKTLAGWATADDHALSGPLTTLLGRLPEPRDLETARRLFARVLDVPGGMRIETVHAFCQSLLRRFPIEAGVPPHFEVMDERDTAALLEEAKEEVLAAGGETLARVTGRIHETAFPDLLADLARDRGKLERMFAHYGGVARVRAAINHRLGLEPGDTPDRVLTALCEDRAFDAVGLRRVAEPGPMADWLADPATRAARFETWRTIFLTDKNTARAKFKNNPVMKAEADRLEAAMDRLRAAAVAHATAALLDLADHLLAAYRRRKTARARMDYDDLILAARDLLAKDGAVAWVLYKLDGGIDHVLIDEAQDTSPDQWAVVAALTGEFFAGRGVYDRVRTVFAVGDVKQSIYGFQGADPRAFTAMRHHFAGLAGAVGHWDEVPLEVSFRSTRAVLTAVDAVFAPGRPARAGVIGEDEDVRHLPMRAEQAGLVEIWPPVEPRPADPVAPWKPPVERIGGDSPATRLAADIAARIARMVGTDMLESRGRPVRAGDILVLVRRRTAFVEDLVRALKSLGVPVAGTDRMVLTDPIAVMDLLALGAVLLLPEDDLTLATVLKSPLIGLTEDQLFDLAWNRGKEVRLWDALRAKSGEGPAFAFAWERLNHLRGLTDRVTPFALFAHVLGPLGGKRRLLERLGAEAEDPLDEFLNAALAFERSNPPSLQRFLHWLEAGGVEIKRDLEQGERDAVRIMTVHGAKGLQASIVFLPDTMSVPVKGDRLLWLDDLLLWPPSSADQDPVCRAVVQERRQAITHEYRRLLYVAMTRAEDRLIVCGWLGRRAAPADCWYHLIRDAVAPFAGEDDTGVLRLTTPQTAPPDRAQKAGEAAPPKSVLPDWATRPPPPEPAPPRPLAPSRAEGEEPAVRSPLDKGGADRFRRGRLIHRLLQTLPDLARADRSAAATRWLARAAPDLDAGSRMAIASEVADVLDHPSFTPLFAPGSRAEVAVSGLIGDRAVQGVVDRLAVTETEVLIADFKTNRRPPADSGQIPDLYVRQMAAYRLALACVYPGRTIKCALVWTDGPRLTEIDPQRMDDALGR